MAVVVAVNHPAVQTFLARRAIAALRDKLGGNITIGKVHIKPFDAVSIQDLVITDEHPYVAPWCAPADTFARINSLSARFSIRGLFYGKAIEIRDAKLKGASIILTTEPDPSDTTRSVNNISRIFGLGGEKEEKEKKESDKEIFHVGRIRLSDVSFCMRNYRSHKDDLPGTINWSDLQVRDITLRGRNISMKGKVLKATADLVSFREKSGFEAKRISGKTSVGGGRTVIEDLLIEEGDTKISMPELRMSYPDGFGGFIDTVDMDAYLDNSAVSMATIGHFSYGLQKMTLRALLDGRFHGKVSDFTLEDMRISDLDGGFAATLNGRLYGLPDAQGMNLDASVSDAEFTTGQLSDFIRALAPAAKLNLGKFAPGETLTLDATATGPINALDIDADILGAGGSIDAGILLGNLLSKAPMTISGSLGTSSLNLGTILGNKQLGPVSLRTNVDASLGGGTTTVKVDTLAIERLHFHGHDYKDITAALDMKGKEMAARLSSRDTSLVLSLDAGMAPTKEGATSYKAKINLDNADLSSLGFVKQDTTKVSLKADADFSLDKGMYAGTTEIRDLSLTDNRGRHDIGDLTIVGDTLGKKNRISVASNLLGLDYEGTASIMEFVKDAQRLSVRRELSSLFPSEDTLFTGNAYSVSFRIHKDSGKLIRYFAPKAYLADSTAILVDISPTGLLSGTVRSNRLAMGTKYLKKANIAFTNAGGKLSCDLSAGELSVSPILMQGLMLGATADGNALGLDLSFRNDSEMENRGQLIADGLLGRDANDSLTLSATIHKSDLVINSDPWQLAAKGISMAGKHIKVDALTMEGDKKSIAVNGGFSTAYSDSLTLDMDNFNLGLLNTFMKQNLDIQGLATGKAMLLSPVAGGKIGLLAGIRIDSTSVSGHPVGTLEVGSQWDDMVNGFKLALRNTLEGTNKMTTTGYFSPGSGTMDITANFNSFDIGFAETFLTSVFSDFGGKLSGNVRVSGPTKRMELASEGLRLDDAFMTVDFTGVKYWLAGPLSLSSDGVRFEDIALNDGDDGKGIVSGGLLWDHLKDIRMDTRLRFSQMEVLDLPAGANPSFYGTAYAGGNVAITGPFKQLSLVVDANTTKDGDFHIPLSSGGTTAKSDLLTFVDPTEKDEWADPYEARLNAGKKQTSSGGDLSIKLNVNVDEGMKAFIDIDNTSGNTLSASGKGDIEVTVRPSRGIFSLGGNYDITDGDVHLNVLDVAKRDLKIREGSAVRFNGEVMDTDLDLSAAYSVKTNIGTLIADTTSTSRRAVNAIIGVTGRLSNPQIGFDVEIPDLDPSTQAQVDAALNTDDKKQKQVLSLLVSGGFLPDETSGIVNNTSMLSNSITEIMAGQLNNILQKLNIPLDLGLDYQSTSAGKSIYDVAVSTALFNNRVIVNGTIGNRDYSSGASSDDVVGDLDIEIKIDKQGALRVKLFSHSADQYTSYLDNSQRNGVGVTYQRDFDNFLHFLRRLFTRKPRRQEQDLLLQREERQMPRKTIRLSGAPLESQSGDTEPLPEVRKRKHDNELR